MGKKCLYKIQHEKNHKHGTVHLTEKQIYIVVKKKAEKYNKFWVPIKCETK